MRREVRGVLGRHPEYTGRYHNQKRMALVSNRFPGVSCRLERKFFTYISFHRTNLCRSSRAFRNSVPAVPDCPAAPRTHKMPHVDVSDFPRGKRLTVGKCVEHLYTSPMSESLDTLRSEEGQLNAVFAFGSAAQHAQFFEEALGEFLLCTTTCHRINSPETGGCSPGATVCWRKPGATKRAKACCWKGS